MTNDPNKDAHSLGIALRLAQAQNRDLRKANERMRVALVECRDALGALTLLDKSSLAEDTYRVAEMAINETDRAT